MIHLWNVFLSLRELRPGWKGVRRSCVQRGDGDSSTLCWHLFRSTNPFHAVAEFVEHNSTIGVCIHILTWPWDSKRPIFWGVCFSRKDHCFNKDFR